MEPIRLGISACLLGQPVRYNGQHKRDAFLADTLGKFVEYVPVCPEVECGLPIPRESMRLVGNPDNPKLMTHNTGKDLTSQMLSWAKCRMTELKDEDLCGFIFKSKSPSSGMERVKVYSSNGGMAGRAPGMFAREFMKAFPLLPCEDDGRLNDSVLRENFVERIFTMRRYRDAVSGSRPMRSITDFHAAHKYLLMSHSQAKCREMGRLVSGSTGQREAKRVAAEYETMLVAILKLLPTAKKHTNVLTHIMGYLKKRVSNDEKRELIEVIENYHQQLVPLIVPVTLLSHYVRKHQIPYLKDQVYLDPHPLELKLRNHA